MFVYPTDKCLINRDKHIYNDDIIHGVQSVWQARYYYYDLFPKRKQVNLKTRLYRYKRVNLLFDPL